VALHARRTLERLLPGARRLTVLGGGPIGVLATLVQPESIEITMVEPNPLRAEQARAVTGRRVAAEKAGLAPADAVLDCAGFKGSLDAALTAARPGGMVLALALHHSGEEIDANQLVASERLVVGCHVFADEMEDALQLLAADPERFRKVVSRVLTVGDLPAAVADAAEGTYAGLKLVVKP
jgi:(R,R)-butanediol dehydrogenase/meso-butanediol dehydrogenase/diacetyl reductase